MSAPASATSRQLLFGSLLLFACIGFFTLGCWQLQRRNWKLDLIARVDARLQAAPIPAPGPDQWAAINAADDEYRRICADGIVLDRRETLVQAVTRLGPGHWVLTPLRIKDGSLILVNRGFVDDEHADPSAHASQYTPDPLHICGLLRLSEPGGAFLHHNDPARGRWYSRDTAAIAAARGLDREPVAPYFIDADAGPDPPTWPVGGLTVVHFRNSHLSYALTWYGLALLSATGLILLLRRERGGRVQSSAIG